MSVTFIQEDIAKMNVDAIVNSANTNLNGGGGVDGAIHAAAGKELDAYCATLGGCEVGEAKLSPGFDLPAKYIIHTVGPVWQGGAYHEKTLLISCYLRSLELALKNHCKSIAFPVISAGAYEYPYEEAMQIAYDTCNLFLNSKQVKMDIYIVLYHGPENLIGKKNKIEQIRHSDHQNFLRVAEYIKENYYHETDEDYLDLVTTVLDVTEPDDEADLSLELPPLEETVDTEINECREYVKTNADILSGPFKPEHHVCAKEACSIEPWDFEPPVTKSVRNSARRIEIPFPIAETFSQMLLRLMKERKMTAPQLYNDACVDRKLFSKIKTNKNYQPKKYIAVSFALALQLSLEDTKKLLESAGYALSRSNFKDLVISSCIEQNIRSVWGVNDMLEEWGLPELFKIG